MDSQLICAMIRNISNSTRNFKFHLNQNSSSLLQANMVQLFVVTLYIHKLYIFSWSMTEKFNVHVTY